MVHAVFCEKSNFKIPYNGIFQHWTFKKLSILCFHKIHSFLIFHHSFSAVDALYFYYSNTYLLIRYRLLVQLNCLNTLLKIPNGWHKIFSTNSMRIFCENKLFAVLCQNCRDVALQVLSYIKLVKNGVS